MWKNEREREREVEEGSYLILRGREDAGWGIEKNRRPRGLAGQREQIAEC